MLVAQKSHVIKLQRDAILEVKRSVGASKNTHFFKKRCEMWVIVIEGISHLKWRYNPLTWKRPKKHEAACRSNWGIVET